jgi:hypothetical protein
MIETVFEHILIRENQGWDVIGSIDLLLICRSWEQRSLHALELLGSRAKKIAIIEFTPSHAAAARSERAGTIEALSKENNSWANLVLGRSTAVSPNMALLENILSDLFLQMGPAANVVIDVSSIPKFYTMSLLAHAFKTGMVAHLRCVYSEGTYAADIGSAGVDAEGQSTFGKFTEGDWKIQPVRYLEGRTAVRDNRSIVVFCGAEEDRIIPQLERYEDHDRQIIISSGGDVAVHADNAERRRDILIRALALQDSDIRFCDPFSLCQALELLRGCAAARSIDNEGFMILPFSTKPHAIACAIAGLNSSASVFCRVPLSYSGRGVAPNGRVFSYHLIDISHPSSLGIL